METGSVPFDLGGHHLSSSRQEEVVIVKERVVEIPVVQYREVRLLDYFSEAESKIANGPGKLLRIVSLFSRGPRAVTGAFPREFQFTTLLLKFLRRRAIGSAVRNKARRRDFDTLRVPVQI